MGKCGVFIPYYSHQVIPIPIFIPMKPAWRFPFLWKSHGIHETHGNFQYILIPTTERATATAAAERIGNGDQQLGVGDDELIMGRTVWTARPGMTSNGD